MRPCRRYSLVFCLPIATSLAVTIVLPIDLYTRAAIQRELELGFDNDTILLGGYDVSLRILQRIRKSWRQYREVYIPSEDRSRRPKALHHLLEEELLAYLEQRPIAYLDEMAFFLLDEFDVQVGKATIWRALTRLGWSWKKYRKVTKEHNQELRDYWFTKLADWRADQLVFLDESTTCKYTGKSSSTLPVLTNST